MIRIVLTVLVAVALLTASMPALETARTATTAERLDSEADRVERAIAGVVSGSVAAGDPSLAARTTTTVRTPSGVTSAPVDRIALVETEQTGGDDVQAADSVDRTGTVRESTVALRYRIDGGPDRDIPVVPETIAANVEIVGGAIELRPSGESRLELRFVDDGEPTVRISRLG